MRIAREAALKWWGKERMTQQKGSLNYAFCQPDDTLPGRLRQQLGKLVYFMTIAGGKGCFPLLNYADCYVGGQWFGVSRRVAELLLKMPDDCPKIVSHFSQCFIPDESYFHTLIGNMKSLRVAPGNHALFWRPGNSGPDTLDENYLERLIISGKYFARRFPLDAEAPFRRQVLQMIKASINGKPSDSETKE
jgi:hypothetical protein